MKTIYIKGRLRYFLIGFFIITLYSCEEHLEVDLPDSQLTGDFVFENEETIEAALLDNYSKLKNSAILTGSSAGLGVLAGLYSDELDLYSTSTGREDFYNNTLIATNNTVNSLWNNGYNVIYGANAIIENLISKELDTEIEQRFFAEALFQRALVHSYLTEIFGAIPYVTQTDYRINSEISKSDRSRILILIIEDLEMALERMPANFISLDKTRPDSNAIKALLSRIELYSQNYIAAEQWASQLIQSGSFNLENTENVFLNNSQETIWQFAPGNSSTNTIEAKTFIFTSVPPPNFALTQSLVSSFEERDLRYQYWVGSISDSTQTWYYSNKYKLIENTASAMENSIVFRFSEQFLIRAEARLMQNDLSGALSDINIIRERAGLSSIMDLESTAIKSLLLEERRKEFFTEFGHRWFDLRRLGELQQTLKPIKPGWEETDKIFPLPNSELLLNPNLRPQNPGYE